MIAKVVISTKTEKRNVQIGSTRIHVGCNTIPNSSPVISGLCILIPYRVTYQTSGLQSSCSAQDDDNNRVILYTLSGMYWVHNFFVLQFHLVGKKQEA